jgi:hypothetical protein
MYRVQDDELKTLQKDFELFILKLQKGRNETAQIETFPADITLFVEFWVDESE